MEPITYYKATLDDIEAIIACRARFIIDFAGEQPAEVAEDFNDQFRDYLTRCINKTYIVYIARQNNTIAGMGGVVLREQPGNFKNPSGRVGYFMSMYTYPEFRRKGICTGILNALTKAAAEMGITVFELHATKDGEFVYKQNGFKMHHEPTYRKYI